MINQFKEAKKNKEILHFKKFQDVEVSWDDILNFLFEETKKEKMSSVTGGMNLPDLGNLGNFLK